MEKTHIELETNIMGKECVLYMQPYYNLPPRTTVTAPCCPYREGLNRRPLAVPRDCPLKNFFVRGGYAKNVKSALCGLYRLGDKKDNIKVKQASPHMYRKRGWSNKD